MAWNDTLLCKASDVEKKVTLLAFASLADKDTDLKSIVQQSIAAAGEEITSKLMDLLPDIYAASAPQIPFSAYLIAQGYSYSDLDNILDKITNPQVLNLTAVAKTISILYTRLISMTQATMASADLTFLTNERNEWERKFEKTYKDDWRQLKLDLNSDNTSSDYEHTRTRSNFTRS